jgi:hypothetical protein
MTRRKAPPTCPQCRRLQLQMRALRAQIDDLQRTVQRLQEQLAAARKDSSSSSKPPSSDIVKPAPARPAGDQAARPPGGQPGHPKHERPATVHGAHPGRSGQGEMTWHWDGRS